MKKKYLQAVLFSAIFANSALAHNISLNAGLPAVTVAQDGELIAKKAKMCNIRVGIALV
ncbi:hypothetical protein EDC51_103209 [Bibersteinia trehalosi]|nr:hypothetical protein EDC51_103209 [Bibersteinia trehalosi]